MSDDHTSPIQTPKQLIVVVVLAFVVPIALFLLLSQLVTSWIRPGTANEDTQVISRIKPFGTIVMADASGPKGNLSGEQVFQAVCKTCHEAGIAGAPKVGDNAAWSASIKKGYDTLIQHAINGFQEPGKVMPPKGGNPDLADVEVQRAVVYMANKSGASFKEPPATAVNPVAVAVAPAGAAASTPAAPTAAVPAASAAVAPPIAAAPASLPSSTAANPKSGAPLDMAAGLALMQKDTCSACHSVDAKIVGPAYKDVAAKYRGDAGAAGRLFAKVKAGGAGVWGPVPMPPNTAVPDDDVKALVNWILALKK